MKNKLFKGLFGITISALSFCLITNVNAATCSGNDCIAEGLDDFDVNVAVGEVDAPVYDVEITWGSLKYNWKYNDTTNKHEWVAEQASNCDRYFLDSTERDNWENIELYTDSTCQTKVADDVTFDEAYNDMKNDVKPYFALGAKIEQNTIQIKDYSENVRVGATLKWNAAENYNWTNAEFVRPMGYTRTCNEIKDNETFEMYKSETLYINDVCDVAASVGTDLSPSFGDGNTYYYQEWEELDPVVGNGELALNGPVFGGVGDVVWPDSTPESYIQAFQEKSAKFKNSYYLRLNLKADSSKEVITPTTGDSIGTVTITLNDLK